MSRRILFRRPDKAALGWVSRSSISLRLLLGVAVPLAALIASLGVFFLVRSDVDRQNDASRGAVSALLQTKAFRDQLSALQLDLVSFVRDPLPETETRVKKATDALRAVGEGEVVGASADEVVALVDSVIGVVERRKAVDSDGQTFAEAGAALRQYVTTNMDTSDVLAPAIIQYFYDMVLAAASSKASNVEALAGKMKAAIEASYFAQDDKTKLNALIQTYLEDFSKVSGAQANVDDGLSASNQRFQQLLGRLDEAVGTAESRVATAASATRESLAFGTSVMSVMIGLSLIVCFGVCWFLSRSISRQLDGLVAVMERIAKGDTTTAPEPAGGRSEVARMTAAVEVFRANAIRIHGLTERERNDLEERRRERAEMMQLLGRSFGEVVDAAASGDFSQRVEVDFPDPELSAIAQSINNLVGAVDEGMGEAGAVLSSLADADLTRRMQGNHKGAFADLRRDTNAVADKLAGIVTQLMSTSGSLRHATAEILSGTSDLSTRTNQQAVSLQGASTAIQQLATTVQKNAERATEASRNAASVTVAAERGGEVMSAATGAMDQISASSNKIGNIIGVIDDIAFQTNLLALNASVEAARAGEAGKGFAVVAVEVRRLAQSAAQASTEVKSLIEQSGAEVLAGGRLVTEASEKLLSILQEVRRNRALLEEIAQESGDQAAAITSISVAVRKMDEATQYNAALVEETKSAISQTEAQAGELDRLVNTFVVDGSPKRTSALRAV